MKKNQSVPKSNPDLAKMTLVNAFEDLQVSRLLHMNNHYARSIFHLQQSVEKAVKSFGYFFGLFDEDIAKNMRWMGHNITNAYPVSLEQYQKIVCFIKHNPNEDYIAYNLAKYSALFNDIERDVEDILEQIKNNSLIINKPDLTSEEITNYLTILNKKNIEAEKFLKLLKNEKVANKLIENLIGNGRIEVKKEIKILCHIKHVPFPVYERKIDEEIESFTLEGMKHAILFTYYQFCSIDPLFYLGMITQHHEQTTRYPNYEKNFDPLEYYNNKNPLIVNYQPIHKFTNLGLNRLEKLFSMEIPSKKTLSGFL